MPERPHTTTNARRRGRRNNLWIVAGVLAVLAAAVAYAAWDVLTVPADEAGRAVASTKPQAANESEGATETTEINAVKVESDLVDDDGQSLWVSPTDGPPLDLSYLPPGVEIILALRPEAIVIHPDGEKSLEAAKPVIANWIQYIDDALPGVRGVARVIIGFTVDRNKQWQTSFVAEVTGHSSASEYLKSRLPGATENRYRGSSYWRANGRAYFLPGGDRAKTIAVVPADLISDVVELAGNPPPLRAEFERLLAHTDSDRQFTLIAPPSLAFRQGEELFVGELFPLWHPLEWLFGNDVSVTALSVDWGDNFFVELVAVPTLDSTPEKMSAELAGRVEKMPELVEEFVLGLDASPYSRRVVARLPEMLRRLAAYTRHGFDKDAAVLRCYLPAAAGHNLIMGAELALAERGGTAGEQVGARPLAEASAPGSIVERLQKKTSLRFGREELEAALDMLAQDVGVEIVIRGPDLQLDGITRNQLFAIDMSDRSGEEILLEILRRANPDKLAAGPADPRQKLVYIVGPEAIFITTRSAVAGRGETLPAVFQEN